MSTTSALAGPYRLTAAQVLLRDTARALADELIAPRAAAIDRAAEFPWDVKELFAEHDLLGITLPEDVGGVGGSLFDAALVMEQISRVCATSGLIVAVQALGALPVVIAGNAGQPVALAAGRRGRTQPDRVRADRGRGGIGCFRRPDPRRRPR